MLKQLASALRVLSDVGPRLVAQLPGVGARGHAVLAA